MRHVRVGAVLLAALLVGMAGCGSDGGTEPEVPVATSITITSTSVTLSSLGATFPLSATIRDQNGRVFSGTVSWTSDNTGVATVDSGGVVTAIGNGTATVTAASGNLTATVPVTVQQVTNVLMIVAGDGQSVRVGQTLADAIVVQANDVGGAPVEGVALAFTAESGEVSPSGANTDAQGQASVTWTLGTTSGEQRLQVGVEGSSVSIRASATALAADPAAFVKSGGDAQVGPVEQALGEPVVVQLQDEFGNGVPGAEVAFLVTLGGGSVDPATVTTGIDGMAQTNWTMGAAVGPAELTASTPGFTTLAFSATAVEAQPDLVVGAMATDPVAPTNLESVKVIAAVTNNGTSSSGGTFQVRLTVDGSETETQTIGPLDAGVSVDVEFTLGPQDVGVRALSMEVDPEGTIPESDEGNNTSVRSLAVALQTSLEVGVPIANVGAAQGVELLFAFELPAEDGSIAFRLSGGTGDADMYVNYEVRPPSRGDSWDCISGAADSNEECRINAALPGVYHVLIHAYSTFSGTTLEVVTGLEVLPYNIEVEFINSGTSAQNAAFTSSALRFENVLPFDITDIPFENQAIPADQCITGQPEITDIVDDLRIYVDLIAIDGPGGTLGRAGPCIIRSATGLPVIGYMQFDTDDLDNLESGGNLTDVILHEMAHVIGIGTIWNLEGQPDLQLLKEPSIGNPGVDTHFVGPLTIAAFDAAGGTGYTAGAKVPVENSGDEGSADGHWRESVLGNELMTPGLNIGENPLSAISIQSLADVGYRVDVGQADAYSFFPAPARVAGADPLIIDLSGDIVRGPLLAVDARGRVVRVIRR
ncbi:MAG: CARDB domain-containing protein [Gemmatimonadota bacterium]